MSIQSGSSLLKAGKWSCMCSIVGVNVGTCSSVLILGHTGQFGAGCNRMLRLAWVARGEYMTHMIASVITVMQETSSLLRSDLSL